jgi:hypothetical protein
VDTIDGPSNAAQPERPLTITIPIDGRLFDAESFQQAKPGNTHGFHCFRRDGLLHYFFPFGRAVLANS